MHWTVRGVVVAVVVAGVVLGAGSGVEAKPKKQSRAKYAKTVCGAYSHLLDDFTTYANGIANLDTTDTAGFASQATTQTNDFLAKVKTEALATARHIDLQALQPSINRVAKAK